MRLTVSIASFTALFLSAAVPAEADGPLVEKLIPKSGGGITRPFADLSQLTRAEQFLVGQEQSPLAGTDVRGKGAGLDVYADVAPAVVVVQTRFGHGTGFFIRDDGWLLTNRHVVEAADYRTRAGGQLVRISVGALDDDGWMQVAEHPVDAVVYRTSVRHDLALLKLLTLPDGWEQTPAIPFAKSAARPGSDCVAIGHPAAGTLWTVRSGEVAGIGEFPRDQVDQIVFLLSVEDGDRERFETMLKSQPQRRRVLLSTCGINPGDSGGPLVDRQGQLVAVTFAVPTIDLERRVDNKSFAYHVHLDEVRDFLNDWPDSPEVETPNPLPAGAFFSFGDQDADGRLETLFVKTSSEPDAAPIGLLVDLDGDSFGGRTTEELGEAGPSPAEFDAEYIISAAPKSRFSFDTDNDGTFDLVFSDEVADEQGEPETRISLQDGRWEITDADGDVFSAAHFADEALGKRFNVLNTPPDE